MKQVSRLGIAAVVAAGLLTIGWWLWGGVPTPERAPLDAQGAAAELPEAAPGLATGVGKEFRVPDKKPPLQRTTASEPLPGGTGALLRVVTNDPLGLLDHPHTLHVHVGARAGTCDWRREGSVLTTRLPEDVDAPTLIEFSIEPLFPTGYVVATAEVRGVASDEYQAELDLSACAAIVELVATGNPERLQSCSLKAKFRPLGSKDGTLDLTEDARESITVIAPVPCAIEAELQSGISRALHKTLIPVFEAGRFRHEIALPTGSLRVIAAHLPGPASRQDVTHTLQLEPSTAFGGGFTRRSAPCEPGSEIVIDLLPPGLYQVQWRANAPRGKVLANQTVSIGSGEAVLQLATPDSDRSLTLQFNAGAITYFNLYRSGTNYGPEQSKTARPGDTQVTFLALDAAEWIVTARRDGLASHLLVDTRRNFDSEAEVPAWAPLTQVNIELAPSLTEGNFYVQIHEPSGFVWQRFINSKHGWTWSYPTHQGLMRIEAVHETGLVAETLLSIPGQSAQPVHLVAPLNFRAP